MALITNARSVIKKYNNELVRLWLLVIAFCGAYLAAPIFKLHFSNPYNISNPYNAQGINPSNNFIVVITTIFLTIAIYYGLLYLYASKYRYLIKVIVTVILIGNYYIFDILSSHAGNSLGPGLLNVFHVGEQLSPAAAFLSGSHLYTNIIFLRGAGIDVVFPALGMAAFGKSLGAYIFANDIYRILSIVTFSLLLGKIIKNPIIYSVVIVLFFAAKGTSITELRDVFIWAVFAMLFYAFNKGTNIKRAKVALYGVGLVSSLMLYISVDRGVLLFSVCGLFTVLLPFLRRRADGTYEITKHYLGNIKHAVPTAAGMFMGLVLPTLFIGLDGFMAFLKLSFHDIPAYAGLLVSMPFPDFIGPVYQIWGPALLAIVASIIFVELLKIKKIPAKYNLLVPISFMLVFSIVCLKMGTNRIDVNKMATVTAPLFFSIILLAYAALKFGTFKNKQAKTLLMPIGLLIVLILVFARFDFSRVIVNPDYTRAQLKAYLKTPSVDDTYWCSWEMNEVARIVRENTTNSEYIYAFTSDPMYYYLTERSNPSRMYINWYNDPQPYTDDLMKALNQHTPKIVIYEEQSWMDAPDSVSMKERLPEVNEWIVHNYPVRTQIGKTTLLSKTSLKISAM